MNISLYLKDKIALFKLPTEISGSFSFDVKNDSSKLINIDAVNGKWILNSTDDVSVYYDNKKVDKVEVAPNHFYILEKDGAKYLIYVEIKNFNKMYAFQYDYINPLEVTNQNDCQIKYTCSFLSNLKLTITKRENYLYLKKDNNIIYKNKVVITSEETVINNGDVIELYGLRLLFLGNIILVNNTKMVSFNSSKGISLYKYPNLDKPMKVDVKDVDLYSKEDYYNKSPRIRRLIEPKVVKLDRPPNANDNQQMPFLLTIGPMITMGATSGLTLINMVTQLVAGSLTFANAWPQLFTSAAMVASMLIWPNIMRNYNKKIAEKNKYDTLLKYAKYFDEKKAELGEESKLQSIILYENLITLDDCLKNIQTKGMGFWDKRNDQNDFLVARLGIGREKLAVQIEYPQEGFTIDDNEMKKRADDLVKSFQYIENVPVGYSFARNKLTAIMGNRYLVVNFINNVILQLVSFYSYDDIKIVVITNKENEKDFEYLKYMNHSFNNSKSFRYFATTLDEAKQVADVLNIEASMRKMNEEQKTPSKPYYLIIVDDYEKIKQYGIIQTITEENANLGFSVIFLENKLSNLPSKCDNFITLGDKKSDILYHAFENQEQNSFTNEIHYGLDLMNISRQLSNIPIEFEDANSELPESITFLEMEKVGKVEQLNILNRWRNNDPTRSLKAEIGVDATGSLMYLDLHEKYHGPHGLIAGMTGSGKSEFIITYILSMAMNYSPEEVSFILIDYKGGGLAGAFENKVTGIVLPHLAGTITNLDKAEMDRTLVSINSELQRRQKLFNEARDNLGESTIDIYKYQSFYREGRLSEPIPHLFIICDEFAELKAQQPDFMDSLISTARIGRSLGVHLILATQKPSGVVNDQIWSNTKFRVCLKVQDASDSKEMLKKPDAASIRQTGRFYLQVGYDEYYTLGQSAWCGAKYFPQEKVVKQVDKSIDFIDDTADKIKTIQEAKSDRAQAQGEQITNILKYIIDVSKQVGVRAKRLWLDNIPEIILQDNIERKYGFQVQANTFEAVIGEYDAPEIQEQGVVKYNLLDNGNTLIYGLEGNERELLLNTMIYSLTKNYNSDLVNFYIVDYGSESLRRYMSLPQVGGMVFQGEDEKFNNLLKMLREELQYRKKILADYGGEYKNYIRSTNNILPIMTIIFNNYDSIYGENNDLYDIIPELVRDSSRYGIVYVFTASAINSVPFKITQNFGNIYAFSLKDKGDYSTLFNVRATSIPRDMFGRGFFKDNDVLHELQVAHIVEDDRLNDFIADFVKKQQHINQKSAKKIPVLPDKVRFEDVDDNQISISNVPIGISKSGLDVVSFDLTQSVGYIITANRLPATKIMVSSMISELVNLNNFVLMIFDPLKGLDLDRRIYKNYYTDDIKENFQVISNYIVSLLEKKSTIDGVILIYGLQKFIDLIDDSKLIEEFVINLKKYEHISMIIVDDVNKLKKYTFENWFKNSIDVNNGLFIGKGIGDQSLLHVSLLKREMLAEIGDDMGYLIMDSSANFVKLIDFISLDD